MKYKYVAFVLAVMLILPTLTLAAPGPRSYLVEQVKAHYSTNGSAVGDPGYGKCSVSTNPCRYGYAQVAPPNNDDVLQYIRVNITSIDNTTLQDRTAFAPVLGNGTDYERVNINVNTTLFDADDAYEIDQYAQDIAPDIQLNATITNQEGGDDLFDADNIGSAGSTNTLIFNFSITNPSSTRTLNNVDVTINFADVLDVEGGTDGESSGSTTIVGDSQVTWSGNLGTSTTVYAWFEATAIEGTDFTGNSINLDTSDDGAQADYGLSSDTFTGYEIVEGERLARGPVRQGIDLAEEPGSGAWKVRGFIENLGEPTPGGNGDYLRYNITRWSIYEIDPATGAPVDNNNANQTGNFSSDPILIPSDSRLYTTDTARTTSPAQWFNSSQLTKPYFAVEFEWGVEWNTTHKERYINTTYDMATLYKIDMSNSASIEGILSPGTGGENISINNTVQHLGSSNAPGETIEILSVVPVNNTDNEFHGDFEIYNDVVVTYENGTDEVVITGDCDITVTQPDSNGASDGLVNVTIADLSAVTGVAHDMIANDQIHVDYIINSHVNMTTGDTYNFTGNATITTQSGTPLTEPLQSRDISASAKQLTGYKDLIGYTPTTPNLINASIIIQAFTNETSNKIAGIKFIDYVPDGTDITTDIATFRSAVTVRYYNGAGWSTWAHGVDYLISDNGTVQLPDGNTVNTYEFTNTSGVGWQLGEGQIINVSYQMDVNQSGTYSLPTIISGFDPITGTEFGFTAIGSITVDIPEPLVPLEIDEGEFSQAKMATVNKPVLWMKDFQVYNPNGRIAPARFSIDAFGDTTNAYVSYYDEYGKKVDEEVSFEVTAEGKKIIWESEMNPYEARNYEVRILTPPVMEVDRNVEVLEELPNKKVKVMMDVFLKNFAEEDYENIAINMPIGYEDVIQARDSFGHELRFTGGKDSSRIIAGDIKSDGMKTVNIIYKQSYPTIIVTPEKDEFSLDGPVGLNILVINGGEKVDYPYLEVEIYTPGMEIIKTDVMKIEGMEPLEKTELTEKYFLPISAPTGMYMASVSFREDFATLASGTGKFFLTGSEPGISQVWGSVLLFIVIIGMGILSYRRLTSVKGYKKKFG